MSTRTLLVAGLAAVLAVAASAAVACGDTAPRMRLAATHVRVGDSVVVRFDVPPVGRRSRGDVWISLVPVGSDDDRVGQRVIIEEGAAEVAVPVGDEGKYELRLVDRSPRRLSRVVARARVDIDRPSSTHEEAPAWYW